RRYRRQRGISLLLLRRTIDPPPRGRSAGVAGRFGICCARDERARPLAPDRGRRAPTVTLNTLCLQPQRFLAPATRSHLAHASFESYGSASRAKRYWETGPRTAHTHDTRVESRISRVGRGRRFRPDGQPDSRADGADRRARSPW